MKAKKIAGLIVLLALIVVAGIAGRNYARKTSSISNGSKLQVVAGENFWGNIASQIGGEHIAVTSIISDPGTDPHLYESNARDATALAKANLVIKNGLGYDDFLDKLLGASKNDQRQVLSVDNILNVGGNNPNPHLWYDIPRVPAVADAIEQALAAKDPANKGAYAASLVAFKGALQPIISTINEIKTKYPSALVAYTERVPGYLLTAANLDVKTPAGFAQAIEEGNTPSPSDTATMESLMTNHLVRVLLYNAQAVNAVTQHIRDLANQSGIPVVGVTETLPTNEPTYQLWQLDQAKALLRALGG